jgi:pilus assembly protein Flp/PilA
MSIVSHITAFFKDEEGASAIEYALVAALIGLAATIGMTNVGTQLNTFFEAVKTKLGSVAPK